MQIQTAETRDREGCAGCFQKVSVRLSRAISGGLRQRGSISREHSQSLSLGVPILHRVLRFFAFAPLRAYQMRSPLQSIRQISALKFRTVKRVAPVPSVAPDRDRVYRHNRKARERFPRAQPLWQLAPTKIAQSRCESFPVHITTAALRQVEIEQNRL